MRRREEGKRRMKKEEKKGKYERKLITIAIAILHIPPRLSSIIYNIYIISYIYTYKLFYIHNVLS